MKVNLFMYCTKHESEVFHDGCCQVIAIVSSVWILPDPLIFFWHSQDILGTFKAIH